MIKESIFSFLKIRKVLIIIFTGIVAIFWNTILFI